MLVHLSAPEVREADIQVVLVRAQARAVIKVPVHTGYRRATLPSVAARLQAREKPERKAVTEEVR